MKHIAAALLLALGGKDISNIILLTQMKKILTKF